MAGSNLIRVQSRVALEALQRLTIVAREETDARRRADGHLIHSTSWREAFLRLSTAISREARQIQDTLDAEGVEGLEGLGDSGDHFDA